MNPRERPLTYIISTSFMDHIVKNVTSDEVDSLCQFVSMYSNLENVLSSKEGVLNMSDPTIVETIGKFGAILVYGSVHLRQLFNRVFSMLPEPEVIDYDKIDASKIFKLKFSDGEI